MVISFALCATLAFAQSNRSVSPKVVDKVAITSGEVDKASHVGYSGSIFTKDGEIFTCDFSATATNYTTGKVTTANEQVDGTNIPQHTNQGYYGEWHRIANIAETESQTFASHYPVLASRFVPNGWFQAFESDSPDNGFMLMSMIDNYSGWGGDGDNGLFDAWVRFSPFSTTDHSMIRVNLYQIYRCFNNDKCYVDYSTNGGTTWGTVEINVRNIDVDGNANLFGWKRVTMPASLGNQTAVTIRIRWADESDQSSIAQGTAGGYMWYFDDFSVTDVPQNHFSFLSNQYFEGFYQMMPQGLQVPVVWAAEFINDGQQAQSNATGTIYTFESGDDATPLVVKSLGTVNADYTLTRSFVIDPLGWYDSATALLWGGLPRHGWGYWSGVHGTGNYACLPTSQVGTYHFFSDITTNFYTPHVGDSITFDTMRYMVNYGMLTDDFNNERPAGIWARDHGAITGDRHYTPGLVPGEGAWTDDYNSTLWNSAGYAVLVSYVTGNTVPQGWKILGIEMVASTTAGMQGVGARISPELWYDYFDSSDINFPMIDHGASTHQITSSEVMSNADLATLTYRTYNQGYPVIRMLFPNQPDLVPNTAYRAGYSLEEDADFAVATSNRSFSRADTTAYFIDEEGMKSYGNILTEYNKFSVTTLDPRDGYLHFYSTNNYPMIRLLVGPGYWVPKTTVTFECDNPDYGYFMNGNNEQLCGVTDSVVVGASTSVYIQPAEGYDIDRITVNGVETDDYTIRYDADSNIYGILTLENITEATTAVCYFKEHIGFDPVANSVSMRLQPNPATSNVHITLKGVSGIVNMSLFDMSGRVVTSSQFNAENGADINVSNLAKGAYFVRITNNKFSKIEKLIVR